MFGYVRPSLDSLSEEERKRYSAVYCGLCRALGDRHGFMGKMSLTYDLTFLVLMLSSLYEPEETAAERTCVSHPLKPHPEVTGAASDYAADMTIALMYHKCLDDWMDDHALLKRGAAALMEKQYAKVQADWPDQCRAIEEAMKKLSALERNGENDPDAAAASFGELMGALFLWKKDFWQDSLRAFGMSVGKFIYLADAAVDYDSDVKNNKYNPLRGMCIPKDEFRQVLTATLSDAAEILEELPLVQDLRILQNILYEGVWLVYNQKLNRQPEGEHHD